MLSNQMLNGIPEVDLGIEVKIKNIEATEAAKEKLLRDQKNKKVWARIFSQQTNTHTWIDLYLFLSFSFRFPVNPITFRTKQYGRKFRTAQSM